MVDNQHKKIPGYRDLSEEAISLIGQIKGAEILVGTLWASIRDSSEANADPRNMALAKTYLEEGFSRFVKAIAKPEDPYVK